MKARTNFTLLYFCLPLIPLGTSREGRDVCLLHAGCLGRRDVVQRRCLFDSVNPGLPGESSCFAPTESCVVCTLSWVVYWQSCEMSKPFDPLLLDMMVDALCSYHFSDFGVGDHVSENEQWAILYKRFWC